jgi:hypothetical protein
MSMKASAHGITAMQVKAHNVMCFTLKSGCIIVLWHTDPLLGNDHETNNDMSTARQRPVHNNGSAVGGSVFYGSPPSIYHSTNRVEVVNECSAVQWRELAGELVD